MVVESPNRGMSRKANSLLFRVKDCTKKAKEVPWLFVTVQLFLIARRRLVDQTFVAKPAGETPRHLLRIA